MLGAALDPRELTFNRFSHRYGDADVEDLKLFINTGAPLGDSGVDVYWFASYGDRQGESAGFYRLPNDSRNFTGIYPDGFLPLINSDLTDFGSTVGVRGTLGDSWNLDLSAGFGQNDFDYRLEGTLNPTFGPGTQRTFDAGGLKYGQWLVNLDLSREISQLSESHHQSSLNRPTNHHDQLGHCSSSLRAHAQTPPKRTVLGRFSRAQAP